MKKVAYVMLVLVLFAGILAACAPRPEQTAPIQTEVSEPEPSYEEPAYEEPTEAPNGDEIPDTVGVPTPFTGRATIDFASEEDMARYPDAPRFAWIEEGIWMMFSFEEPVRDVVLVGISSYFDEAVDFWLYEIGKLVYEAGDLAPGQPFFVQTFGHFGTLPAQAIGFTYTDGIRYYIPFDQSQMDGSLVLHKWAAFTFDS